MLSFFQPPLAKIHLCQVQRADRSEELIWPVNSLGGVYCLDYRPFSLLYSSQSSVTLARVSVVNRYPVFFFSNSRSKQFFACMANVSE